MTTTQLAARPETPTYYDRFREIDFWRETFPQLSISDDSQRAGALLEEPTLLQTRMRTDGYFQGRNETLHTLAPTLADAVAQCVAQQIPPPFLFLFDEAWQAFASLSGLITHVLGMGYLILPDFWVWHLDPQKQDAGWAPHRDKGRMSLAPDGSPLSLTIWLPLTEATPLNGCMYLLPASQDPNYNTPNENEIYFDLPNIRALPALPGDFLCWNQAVRHWGGRASPFAAGPRISMALEFQRCDVAAFNTPLLRPLEPIDFDLRLKLVAKQILQYRHLYALPAPLEQFARGITGKPA